MTTPHAPIVATLPAGEVHISMQNGHGLFGGFSVRARGTYWPTDAEEDSIDSQEIAYQDYCAHCIARDVVARTFTEAGRTADSEVIDAGLPDGYDVCTCDD